MTLLAPNLHQLPSGHIDLNDQDTCYRKHYLDFAPNEDTNRAFIAHGRIVNYVRRFFDNLGSLEAGTPMMSMFADNVAAKPFVTHHDDPDFDLYRRIASGLYLRQLGGGGVYEIGNESRYPSSTWHTRTCTTS